ncbi:MAG: 4-alpha-glucanotransferase [Acidobacteriota bacterium]
MKHTSQVHFEGNRVAGVLLHPTSLPGRFGIGDLGDELTAFLDWAGSAGMGLWQVLPLNPPGYGNSPYGCLSSFAGNPMLISPQRLVEEGLLPANALLGVPRFSGDHVDFERVHAWKWKLLRIAFARHHDSEDLASFNAKESAWLEDFALYMTLRNRSGGAPWWEWEKKLAHRDEDALAGARLELDREIAFHKFVQWIFFRQWAAVREVATARRITIMGDVPIYVASDSADVWAARHLFQLDDAGQPTVVAGVPPDYFSETGQRWGNPLYRWDLMARDGYSWWVSRVRANLGLADVIRLDHFRGFAAYWEIPAHEKTATNGRWVPGPGIALFDAIRKGLGSLPLVAEDLGFITPEVIELRHATGLPGMKILQFGFAQIDSPHLPHRYEEDTVVYTGTHDNDTARGWYDQAPEEEQQLARAYLGEECHDVAWSLIRTAYTSVARTAIIPVQDILGLGSDARMNCPGASLDNWRWRLDSDALTREHADRLRRLAVISGRT